MKIVRAITSDGLVGYDEFGQLVVRLDGDDGSSLYRFIRDVREMTCAICSHGWEPLGPSMDDQFVWRLLDETVHRSCHVRHLGLVERSMFSCALVSARVRFQRLALLPNRYWPAGDPWAAKPWYRADLLDHSVSFVLGWRKNVAHIEVRPRAEPESSAEEEVTPLDWWEAAALAFRDEDVTKGFGPNSIVLHAWGRSRVEEYIERLVELGGLRS